MKVTSSVLVLAAALGAAAHPSAHAQAHAVRRGFVVANKPVTVTEVVYAQPTQPAANKPEVNSVPSASPSEGGKKDEGKSTGTYKEFCGGKKAKRATTAQIAYKGNTGVEGQFGCNMMEVDQSIAEQYKYLMTFSNNVDKDQKCVCFNKIGPKGLIDGFWKGNEAVSFDLKAKGKAYIAVQENTQGGCTCGVGAVPYTGIGQFAGTWLEMDMANESNGGWSGADASCLVSSDAKVDIPALKVCGHNTCSTIYAGGAGENAYTAGTHDLDGVGLNITPGKVRLEITVG
jgi:hypothetical protein